jgi:hypothetical protein
VPASTSFLSASVIHGGAVGVPLLVPGAAAGAVVDCAVARTGAFNSAAPTPAPPTAAAVAAAKIHFLMAVPFHSNRSLGREQVNDRKPR